MKINFSLLAFTACTIISVHSFAQTTTDKKPHKNLYMDVHQLQPGKVTFEDVDAAHKKDIAVEQKYGVDFQKFWVDESKGLVYCLVAANDTASIRKTHAEAHGLLPSQIFQVTEGPEAKLKGPNSLFMDMHYLGAGKVTAKDVAIAHKKDLAVQEKYGVNLINYWVDGKAGVVMCLAQAPDSSALINTHKEANGAGLVPAAVMKVKQGQ